MTLKTTLSFSILLGSLFFSQAQTLPTLVEPEGVDNNTYSTSQAITTLPSKVKGRIFPNADVDFYSFTATAGDKFFATCMTSGSGSGSFDGVLTLYASDGTTIIETDNDDGSFATTSPSIAGTTLTTTGTYYVKVNHFSATSQMRPYYLYMNVVSGSSTAEIEPNDTNPTATPMPSNLFVNGSLSATTDIDVYSVTLNAGESIYVSLDLDPERDSTTWNGQLLFGPFGVTNTNLLINDTNATSPNSEAFLVTALNAGTYYITVSVPTAGTTYGTYQLAASKYAKTTGYTNYANTTTPTAITDLGITSSSITITDPGRIQDIAVNLNIDHTSMPDLDVVLTAPDGSTMQLFTDIGNVAFTKMNTRFSDHAAITPAFQIMEGLVYQTEIATWLESFKYSNMQGVWTLTIYDDLTANTGTLNSWSIDILTEPEPFTGGTQIYGNDFETTDGLMTHTGTADSWAWGTPTAAPITTAYSGTKCWKTNLTGTYSVSSVNTLETPEIDLTAVLSGVTYAKWASKSQIESANFDNFKITAVEVGGLNRTVELYNWYGATQTQSIGNPSFTIQNSNTWSVYYADLSIFNGSKFKLRFNLTSDNSVQLSGTAIDDVFVFNNPPLSNSNFTSDNNFTIYPNPTSDNFTLYLNETNFSNDTNYKIFDLNGRELISSKINDVETKINLEKFSSGIYLIEVNSVKGKSVKRIVKK